MNDTPAYDIPDTATAGVRAVLGAVRAGRGEDVPRLLAPLPDAERRTCLPVLKTWRAAVRSAFDPDSRNVRAALLYAGAGCTTGAAAAAQWIASTELRWGTSDDALVVAVVAHRGPEWLAQVVQRLAERRTVAEDGYPLIAGLARVAGCEPPTTDGLVLGWERSIDDWSRSVEDELRKDPLLTAMVPRLFEVPGTGSAFQYPRHDGSSWPRALARLAGEGLLDRAMLLDGCLSRLLREPRLGTVRGFLALLAELDPTEDESAARVTAWVRMSADAHVQAAARAQQALAALDEAGRLDDEHLVEASRAALVRPEKKIVRAQLALLDKAMKRDRSRTGALLPVVAETFAQEDHSLQERALALAARHREHADAAVLAEVAADTDRLRLDLRQRAMEVFGDAVPAGSADAAPTGAVPDSPLPPAPEPERLAPPPATAAELAEEIAALLHRPGTPAQEERALNGLVVHAHTDRAGMRAALEPVVARRRERVPHGDRTYDGLWFVVYTAAYGLPPRDLDYIRYRGEEHQCPHSATGSIRFLRTTEAAIRMQGAPLPFLLATPTWSTGTIDPADLVVRIAGYERSGTEPGPVDLRQALLRLGRDVSPQTLSAAERLTSPAGRRLAEWLASGGLPDPAVTRTAEPLRLRSPRPGVLVRTEAVPGHEAWPEPFRSLLAEHDPVGSPCKCHSGGECSADALAILPQHREIIAGRMLMSVAISAEFDHLDEHAPVLPALAESGGDAGPATHLIVAYGLGARRLDSQMHAVDAILTLAARGQLDAERLGGDIAELTVLRRLKAQRYVTALREASRGGAHALVWSVLSGALPVLLRGTPPHGTSAVITLAADCAELSGARGSAIPCITELASRSGSSQLVKQARRIRDTIAGPAGR
ncbi:DUF6493 family protein [Nocardiopsis mangrovi]|uniref:DUF6493 family protein n=1 Tax=Nocardiopsis mangrovi TaxID=1179818 RepID=A0ABV9DSU9_9ACTN